MGNGYDAFAVDKSVNGNILHFNMMFCFYHLDWKNKIPNLNEDKFMNLSFRL